MAPADLWKFYFKWIAANALSEMVGLGATFAVLAVGLTRFNFPSGVTGILLGYGLAILSGIIEASIVGWAQWRVIKTRLPDLHIRAWWRATVIGVLLAYCLGYLPSTLMSLQESNAQMIPIEPAPWVVPLLAAGMGLAGGLVLSFFQWLELRRYFQRAGRWLPANMIAWMCGMPVIFWGIDQAEKLNEIYLQILLLAGTLLLVGAIVGAVHGLILTQMVREGKLHPVKHERVPGSVASGKFL